ncbi:MAG: 50S ribosomal protein L4 [Candidatus Dormibacteraeota bacterium]|uniref:Large ribosomal subunit protein uL4 n=1 Tax=Candidatus Dormiibacter inghamiae TaxID=3127013 RepID=A0A934KC62_9BACT|nr:50S ribosomal protein L4 [Candidatus Dormibacteraeota bacterium]MBJ7605503.1 50S ribosomal protein L4 [Candidatus Dormibacteraeota bacterium]
MSGAAAEHEVEATPAAIEKTAQEAEPGKRKTGTRGASAAKAVSRGSATESESADPLSVPTYTAGGERSGRFDLPESIFGQVPHMAVMHQAFLRQRNNARQGTAKVKHRDEVAGGGAKPYRQKGTGRARHGSTREPSMVGGGTVFGPEPRSYAEKMPRKMRRLALRSALSVKASERKVTVLENFVMEEPRTAEMVSLLHAIGVDDTALVVLPAANEVVARSTSNLPWAKVILASNLNLYDLFTHDRVIIAKDAVSVLEQTFSPPAPRRGWVAEEAGG